MESNDAQRVIDEGEKTEKQIAETIQKLERDTTGSQVTLSQVRELMQAFQARNQEIMKASNAIYDARQRSEIELRQSSEKRDSEKQRAEEEFRNNMAMRDRERMGVPFNFYDAIRGNPEPEWRDRLERATYEADRSYHEKEVAHMNSNRIWQQNLLKLEELVRRLGLSIGKLQEYSWKLEFESRGR